MAWLRTYPAQPPVAWMASSSATPSRAARLLRLRAVVRRAEHAHRGVAVMRKLQWMLIQPSRTG